MTNIIDRTDQPDQSSGGSRARFIQRAKKKLIEAVKDRLDDVSVGSLAGEHEIEIGVGSLDEPSFTPDSNSGDHYIPVTGNTRYKKGDLIPRPQGSGSSSAGSGEGGDDSEELVTVRLSKSEFIDLVLEGLELPNFIKESLKKDVKYKRVRAGVSKDGVPTQLNLKKTFEQAISRRLALQAERIRDGENTNEASIPFLDDVDLRYNWYKNIPNPIKQAVMIFAMDKSGSMIKSYTKLAKNFAFLVNLFLEQNYAHVDLVFIAYDWTAKEITEEEFFGKNTGGSTRASSALELAYEIIQRRYNPSIWNIYITQVSDGDNLSIDNEKVLSLLVNKLLPITQYYIYIETCSKIDDELQTLRAGLPDPGIWKLSELFFAYVLDHHVNFGMGKVYKTEDLVPLVKQLFAPK